MISAGALMKLLTDAGVSTVSGVPCSYLTPVINRAISDPLVRYIPATQEGESVAIAAGAWLGGGLGCVIGQNSGLGNMVNPLTSLMHISAIPSVLIITWRGGPTDADETQHELMGRITPDLLELMKIPWEKVGGDPGVLANTVSRTVDGAKSAARPHALLLPDGTVEPEELVEDTLLPRHGDVKVHPVRGARPRRVEVLETVCEVAAPHVPLVATTGVTSRELATIDDSARNFYLVGAMGSTLGVGLGLALHIERPVIALDGDGSLLMRMGSMATVGALASRNLIHIVLDNGVHDSTGGQQTVSTTVDLCQIATACGYTNVHDCSDQDSLNEAVSQACSRHAGPTFVRARIQPGHLPNLGRPTGEPAEIARRFRDFITSSAPATPLGVQ